MQLSSLASSLMTTIMVSSAHIVARWMCRNGRAYNQVNSIYWSETKQKTYHVRSATRRRSRLARPPVADPDMQSSFASIPAKAPIVSLVERRTTPTKTYAEMVLVVGHLYPPALCMTFLVIPMLVFTCLAVYLAVNMPSSQLTSPF